MSYQPSQTKHRTGWTSKRLSMRGTWTLSVCCPHSIVFIVCLEYYRIKLGTCTTETKLHVVLYQPYKSVFFFQCINLSEFITEMSKNNRFRINGLSRDPGSMNFGTLLKRHPKFVESRSQFRFLHPPLLPYFQHLLMLLKFCTLKT